MEEYSGLSLAVILSPSAWERQECQSQRERLEDARLMALNVEKAVTGQARRVGLRGLEKQGNRCSPWASRERAAGPTPGL